MRKRGLKRYYKMRIVSLILVFGILCSLGQTISYANENYIIDGHEMSYGGIQLRAMGDYGGNLTGATWYWPIHGYSSISQAYSKITSSYGFRGNSYQAYHKGVDIGEAKGTAVYSVRGGTVSVVDNNTSGSEGRSIIINHNDGYYSVYMHLSSISVSQGQAVDANTKIGAVGGSGFGSETAYGYHLHLGIHYGSSFNWECNVNPCPSGYTRIGDSLQASAGGYPVGSASISYSINTTSSDTNTGGIITNTNQVLRYGDSGESVRQLQTALNKVMNAGLATDGKYGQGTHDAVKAFQSKYGLTVDGDAGPATLTKLNQLAGGHTHSFITENEAVHPHREYKKCTSCGHTELTGNTGYYSTCATCTTPGTPALENMWDTYLLDDEDTATITFSWLATSNTTHYNLYTHKKNSSGEYEVYQTHHYAENGMSIAFEPGEYRVQLQSTNSNGSGWPYSDSPWYYFEVIDDVDTTSISVDKSFVNLCPNETTIITASVLPENATNKNVIWKSSDESVTEITEIIYGDADNNGIVDDADIELMQSIIMNSTEVDERTMLASDMDNDGRILAIDLLHVKKIIDGSYNANDYPKNVIVTSKNVGKAIITATTEDGGFSASCEVLVDKPITSTTYKTLTSTYKFYIECESELNNELLVVACYDDNGRVIALEQIECDGDTSYTASVPKYTNIKYAKVFLWNGYSELEPMGMAETVTIN